MKRKKRFDCVEMKLRLQARHRAELSRLGRAGLETKGRRWRELSDDPLAVWWRLVEREKSSA